jgi:hypothetical protein
MKQRKGNKRMRREISEGLKVNKRKCGKTEKRG